jgi:apolipoprotein N-acyltransferase
MMADDGVVPGVHLRLVQPDIPQSLKWDPALRERHFQRTLELTRAPGFSGRTHIIWPETATPFAMAGDAARRLAIASAVPSGGLLITGAPRVEVEPGRPIRVWNSLHAIDGGGAIVATYDKFHLVPFGEYVPFRRILGFINLIPGAVDFTAGPGPRTLAPPGLPRLSPLICYEAIFPAHVLDSADRPGWLLNLTNDAWFGLSSGPYQHFAAARFRAVEEGLPLVRAANNGISAIVDAYGRVVVELGLGRSGVLDGDLPRALPRTPYARFGDAIVLAIGLVLLAPAALRRRRG